MTLELRTIRHDEYDAAVENMQKAFDEPPEFFDTFMRHDPRFDQDHIIGGFADGRLVSAHIVLPREVWIAGTRLHLGAIANVSTDPATRGKGYASEMMRFSVEEMRRRGYELSALYGWDKFYSRFGWHNVHRQVAVCSNPLRRGETRAPSSVHWPDDLPALMELHRDSVARHTGLQHRTETYWRRWIRDYRVHHCRWLDYWIIERGDGPVGYLAATHDKKQAALRVCEYAFRDGNVLATAESSAALAASMGLDKVVFHTTDPQLRDSLGQVFGVVEVEKELDAMYQLLLPGVFRERTGLPIQNTDEFCGYLEDNAYMAFRPDDF